MPTNVTKITDIIADNQCVTNHELQNMEFVKPIIFMPSLSLNSFSTTIDFITRTTFV